MQSGPNPYVADDHELSLVKHMAFGALSGIVAWGLVSLLVVRLGWPAESWGFAAVLAVFSGLWVGPFFGSAAGVAVHHLRTDAGADAPAPAPVTAVPPATAAAAAH